MPRYRVEVGQAHSHRFIVTMELDQPQLEQHLSLPVWIPGSYLVREFARHLSPISAQQGRRKLTVTPTGKASWQVNTDGRSPLVLRYEVYAFDTSVRAAFLDAQRGFFNGTSVFLKAEGFENAPHHLTLAGLPPGWRVATALPKVKVKASGLGDYLASDYDALVDHPVELGSFWQGEFTVRGVRHELVVSGAPDDFDGAKLLADTQRICDAQLAFWHGRRKAPFDHYVFLLNVVDEGYGGLEHRQSTALICARRDVPRVDRPLNKDNHTTLLGLISHEYFHTWNVKRLKPTAFAPYDYTQENHTRMLWFFEGFTSYYDDQFLLRTGLINAATYLKLLAKTINQVASTPGRLQHSVAQASFDAWTRYYRPDENTANATVSYYTKGSLVALALDLSLRQLPTRPDQHVPTLDGVMLRLWQLKRPITAADVAHALADEAEALPPHTLGLPAGMTPHQAWAALLHRWTEGVEDLPLEDLLTQHGVSWHQQAASVAQQMGVRLNEAGGIVKVQAVMRDSQAERMGLSSGDEWLALNGWRIKRSEDIGQWHDAKHKQTALVSRDGRILTLSCPAERSQAKALTQAHASTVTALGLTDLSEDGSGTARRLAWLKA